MKTFIVEMLAFGKPGELREVDVPDKDLVATDIEVQLSHIYYWGQNDFQNKPHCSVSMGDVIRHGDDKYLVCSGSFYKMTADEYVAYLKVERPDRSLVAMVVGDLPEDFLQLHPDHTGKGLTLTEALARLKMTPTDKPTPN